MKNFLTRKMHWDLQKNNYNANFWVSSASQMPITPSVSMPYKIAHPQTATVIPDHPR